MHKFIALAGALAAFGFVSAASAADMPVKAPVAAIAAPSWTGWYIGLNAGGNWGTSQTSTTVGNSTTPAFFIPAAQAAINSIGTPTNFNTSGFTGGVQGGYNYQIGQWLLGVEADFEYFRSAGSKSVTGPFVAPLSNTITSSISTDWLFTARPRLGLVLNNWLLYGTGGVAVTNLRPTWNFVVNPGAVTTESASASVTKAGWTVGGGVETMLPEKWSIGVEYLYVNFGSVSANSTAFGSGAPITNLFTHSADLTSNIVRFRLNKLF